MSVWEYHASINKLKSTAMELGKLVRYFNCVAISAADDFVYAGSKSGDLMQINLKRNILRCTGPKKALPGGITACSTLPGYSAVLIGTGNGLLGLMRVPEEVRRCAQSMSASDCSLHRRSGTFNHMSFCRGVRQPGRGMVAILKQ